MSQKVIVVSSQSHSCAHLDLFAVVRSLFARLFFSHFLYASEMPKFNTYVAFCYICLFTADMLDVSQEDIV